MSEVISPFRSLRAGLQLFDILMLCVFHYAYYGRIRAYSFYASYHLVYLFVCHQNHVCEQYIDSVFVGGYCLSWDSVFSVNCAQSAFL